MHLFALDVVMRRLFSLAIGAAVLLGSASVTAQVAPKGPGFRAEYLAEPSVAEDHVVRLAEAIPADKYTWRPAHGVRSISEALHLASSHNNMPRILASVRARECSLRITTSRL